MVGRLIRERRNARGWSQERLAEEYPTSHRQIVRWEKYSSQLPREAQRTRLGELLGISPPEWLHTAGEALEAQQAAKSEAEMRASLLDRIGAYPYYDAVVALDMDVSAGRKGGRIPQGLEGVETLPRIGDQQHYALRVTGDCMEPEVKPGDIVIFDPEAEIEDGNMVVAAQDGEIALVKWYNRVSTMQYLIPLNGDPIVIDEHIELVGVVKDIKRKPKPMPRNKRVRPVSPDQRPLPGA